MIPSAAVEHDASIPPTERQRLAGSVHEMHGIAARPAEGAVLRALKIPRVRRLDELDDTVLVREVRRAMERAQDLVRCRAVARWLGLGDGRVPPHPRAAELLRGRDVARWLDGCTRATLIVATVGAELPARVDRLQRCSLTEAMVLDAVGSAWIEAVVDTVDRDVGRAVERAGFVPTRRRSPGYGDWPLEVQPAVLRTCHAERIGVTCDPAHLLVPVKSVTAIIGWRSAGEASA